MLNVILSYIYQPSRDSKLLDFKMGVAVTLPELSEWTLRDLHSVTHIQLEVKTKVWWRVCN